MSRFTPEQLVFIALQHYEAGRLNAADDLCRKVLSDGPTRGDALYLSSLIATRAARHEAAGAFLLRAIAVEPENPKYHFELGLIHRRSGKLEAAISALREAMRLAPNDYDILRDFVSALEESGQLEAAAEACRQVLALRPVAIELRIRLADMLLRMNRPTEAVAELELALARQTGDAAIRVKLGSALEAVGRADEAMAAFARAAELDQGAPEPLDRLGNALHNKGRIEEAAARFRQAIARCPTYVPPHVHLGDCMLELGFADSAMESYRRALALKPSDGVLLHQLKAALPDAYLSEGIAECRAATLRDPGNAQAFCNLGVANHRQRNADAAIRAYRRALEIDPAHMAAMNNLALTLKDVGNIAGSIKLLRQTVEIHPDSYQCRGNLLYLLHFDPDCDWTLLRREQAIGQQQHAEPLKASIRPRNNNRSPGGRLRIGYVSPNFRQHSVGRFLTALFDNHDNGQFEIFAYSDVRRSDDITARIRGRCDRWADTTHLTDEALAERIRSDRIDILVDLTMHMADSRLLAFARKPAPIQVTYLGYCSSTGLETIDYRLTDPYLDLDLNLDHRGISNYSLGASNQLPPSVLRGREQNRYPGVESERPLRLPQSYWCYDPGMETPAVNPLPALSTGYVTFASLNNFCKASPAALVLWARILSAVPSAQLILHAWPGEHRDRTQELFASEGIDGSRLRFFDMLSLPNYFRLHHAIDIALDSFPYPGGTTTCDALWMGVPTISLVGKMPFMRSGLSILSNVGLPELAVESQEQYLEAAVGLAGDLPRLSQLRSTMRDRLRGSPLMDGPRFARDVEGAFRSVWRGWCGT